VLIVLFDQISVSVNMYPKILVGTNFMLLTS